jgi:lysophospholipase L1-like esterase
MNLKYCFGALISVPLLPLMYFQGQKIRKSVPALPEASGTSGIATLIGASKTIHMITIGESTIAGVGVKTHEEGFSGSLARELGSLIHANVSWKVYAKSGYTASKVREKIIPEIKESRVDLIVIGLGGNDAFTLNTPKRWKRNIDELIQELEIKFPKAVIFFCNMPPIKEFPAFTTIIKFTIGNLVEILGQELALTIQKFDHVYYASDIITIAGWIEKEKQNLKKQDFFSDGVHPSPLTYQTWAKEIASLVVYKSNINRITEMNH